jgi:hypothetical protein
MHKTDDKPIVLPLTSLRRRYRSWQALLDDDGIPQAAATAVRLAVDGWWLASVLDLAPPRPQHAAQLRALLEDLVAANIPPS